MRTIAANYIFPIGRDPIKNGYIKLNDDNVIIDIGVLRNECESTEFYNGIICPGFTNAHCHIELSHLKGLFEKGTGMAGFIRQINDLRTSCDKQNRVDSLSLEMERMYLSGVSNLGDISNCNESFEVKSKSDIYSRSFLEVFGTKAEDVGQIIEEVLALKKEADALGLDAAPTPHSCYTSSRELLLNVSREGLKSGFLSYHSQESDEEEDMIRYGTGALAEDYKSRGLPTPEPCGKSALIYYLEILKELGRESFDENVLLVHNIFTDQQSIDMAKAMLKNCFWVTCPLSNLFIHNKLAPLDLFRKNGLKIALGTDSLSSNDTLSIVDEISCIQQHFPHISLDEILTWTCLNGAEALGRDRITGSFEIGKKPGVVLIENIDFSSMKLTKESKSKRLV